MLQTGSMSVCALYINDYYDCNIDVTMLSELKNNIVNSLIQSTAEKWYIWTEYLHWRAAFNRWK